MDAYQSDVGKYRFHVPHTFVIVPPVMSVELPKTPSAIFAIQRLNQGGSTLIGNSIERDRA